MKNMKLRVVALILIIPLLLIFTTTTVTTRVELLVNVPVNSVEIKEIPLQTDISLGEPIIIDVVISPSNAKADVVLTAEATEGKENSLATVYIEDNKVYPLSTGNVRIKASAGGKYDFVDLYFYSAKPIDGDISVKQSFVHLKEGESFDALKNLDMSIEQPSGFLFSSSDKSVVTVNSLFGTGVAKAPGTSVIELTYTGIEINTVGKVEEKTFKHEFTVTVGIDKVLNPTGISFGGANASSFIDIENGETQKELYFWFDENDYSFDDFSFEYDSTIISSVKKSLESSGKVKVEVSFIAFSADALSESSTFLKIKKGDSTLKEYEFYGGEAGTIVPDHPVSVDLKLLSNEKVIAQRTDTYKNYALLMDENNEPIDDDTYYAEIISSNTDILKVRYIAGGVQVIGLEKGNVTISINLRSRMDNKVIASSSPIQVSVVKPYENLTIEKSLMPVNVKKSALDSVVAIGEYSFNGGDIMPYNQVENSIMPISGVYCNQDKGYSINEVVWRTTDENIAKVEGGKLILGNVGGTVTLTVENAEKVGVAKYDNCSASITINIIKGGVNTSTEDQLLSLWQNGENPVVLKNDIRIASFVEDAIENGTINDANIQKEIQAKAEAYLHSMRTTGEGRYFVNNGMESQAVISYLMEITTSIYGNGYSIDADCLTIKVNSRFSTFNARFNGPIDLVRYSQEGKMNATVKAQDNIVFLVNKNGISINNVELKGCSDSSILSESRDSVDLTKLDNVGTVLEIVGDNCSVSYSRINNGRTVVRIYGKGYNDINTTYASDHRINASINNSILSYGREFVLKVGTNYSKKTAYYKHDGINYLNTGNYFPHSYKQLYDEASPYLTKENGDNYLPGENNINDEYFYNNYVLVDLTVEDCVFENAGLFTVGLESTFGGLCLHGYDYSANYRFGQPTSSGGIGWGGIAGTSYPAILRLKGDVRFYDWKLLSSVNSDTLVTGPQDLLDIIGLNMNVSSLIDTYSQQEENKDIVSVYEQDKQRYVNGAIAIYGGGKNYSYVDCLGVNKTDIDSKNKAFEPLKDYSVPVSCFIKDRTVLIYYTAGAEDFRFHLYDATSELDVAKQLSDIADGSAYSWLMK